MLLSHGYHKSVLSKSQLSQHHLIFVIAIIRSSKGCKLQSYIISCWLHQNIPQWEKLEITSAAIYLGFFLGPKALQSQWTAPTKKYSARVAEIARSGAPAALAAYAYNSKAVPVLGYVAQLLPPPDNMQKLETNALHALTHMATNAYTYDNFFGMHLFGGPKFRCARALAHSAMVRAAISNAQHWYKWKPQLERAANSSLCLHMAYNERCSPDFWDTDPIAINLSRAYAGSATPEEFSSATSSALRLICNGPPPPDPASFPPTPKIQSIVYDAIMKHALDSDPGPIICRRINDMFAPYDTTMISPEIHNCRALLCRLKKAEALMVLKTWGNAWATSYRFHEPVLLPCLLGCYHGIDKLAHYVVCPWLFKFVSLLRPGTSSNPLDRIAMHNTSLDSVKVVACIFSGYHAIKCTPHLSKIASTSRTDSSALFSTAVSFAEAFLASSHAMCLQCKSLTSFRSNLEEYLGVVCSSTEGLTQQSTQTETALVVNSSTEGQTQQSAHFESVLPVRSSAEGHTGLPTLSVVAHSNVQTVTDTHVGASLYNGQAPWPDIAEEQRNDPAIQRAQT